MTPWGLRQMAVQGRAVAQSTPPVGGRRSALGGRLTPNPPTTVWLPLVTMAQEGLKKLNMLMSSKKIEKAEKIFLPTELVIRESCRAPRQG